MLGQYGTASQFISHALNILKGARDAGSLDLAVLYCSLLDELCGTSFSTADQAKAARAILQFSPVPEPLAEALAERCKDWGPAVRNELARVLPVKFRPQVVKGSLGPSAPQQTALRAIPVASQSKSEIVDGVQDPTESGSVILVGIDPEHTGNRALLLNNGLAAHRVHDPLEFFAHVAPSVAGIVIGSSCWAQLPQNTHQEWLDGVLAFSNLAWMKIDIRGLDNSIDLAKTLVKARLAEPLAMDLVYGESSRLNETDVRAISAADAILSGFNQVTFLLSDLSDSEIRLLVAAVSKSLRTRSIRKVERIHVAETSFVPGGRTGAKVVLVKPGNDGGPVLVKIDSATNIREETNRFIQHIALWDDLLRPQTHYHSNIGAIVFCLVSHEDSQRPAPSLESLLQHFSLCELYPELCDTSIDQIKARYCNLVLALLGKLERLNRQQYVDCGLTSFASLRTNLPELADRGIEWIILECGSLLELVTHALRITEPHSTKAVVHGDLNLRNVLIRGSEPHLVDYACCGPGHPYFDIARLICAITMQFIRNVDQEEGLVEIFTKLIEGRSFDDIASEHSSWCRPDSNQLCLRTFSDGIACIRQLESQYRLGPEQVYGVLFLIAAQSLTMPSLQSFAARALACSTGRHLRASIDTGSEGCGPWAARRL